MTFSRLMSSMNFTPILHQQKRGVSCLRIALCGMDKSQNFVNIFYKTYKNVQFS